MFPNVEIRYLHAVIVLAEELSYTRAAHRLHISQPALSKQIIELEEQCRFHLFTRDKKRVVELTDAGRIFVEEAKSALLHSERAVHLARAVHEGCERVVTIGYTPDADESWISSVFTIRLPLFPNLRIRLMSQFALELVRSVLAGELSFALVTAPPREAQITAVPFAKAPLYAAVPETHPAARKECIDLEDLAKDEWILLARRAYPIIYDAIMNAATRKGIVPKPLHDVITGQQAVHLVSEHLGIAILTKPTALGSRFRGVVVKPLSDPSLWFETCVVMKANDDSRVVNEFVRSFLRKCIPSEPEKQMDLPLTA
jgi:DNA-binding transcriptional LysR family regulator